MPDDRHGSYVVIDPKLTFGQPCLRGRRLTADLIAEQYWHLGEHLQTEILDNYEITRADVLACCYYQAAYGSRTWRRRWKAWLKDSWSVTGLGDGTGGYRGWWSAAFSDVPLPPTRKQAEDTSDGE